jgi:DNA-directed RNA polymerase subunit RPC12/RpoP
MIYKCSYCGQVKEVQVIEKSRTGSGKTVAKIYACAKCLEEGRPPHRP